MRTKRDGVCISQHSVYNKWSISIISLLHLPKTFYTNIRVSPQLYIFKGGPLLRIIIKSFLTKHNSNQVLSMA